MKKLLILILVLLLLVVLWWLFSGHDSHDHTHEGGTEHSHIEPTHKEEAKQSDVHEHMGHNRPESAEVAIESLSVPGMTKQVTVESSNEIANAFEVSVENGWVKEMIPGSSVTAAYFDISSNPLAFRLLSSPEFERVEIHDMEMSSSGAMSMKKLKQLAVGLEGVSLKPGGKHLMLINPKKELKTGDVVTINIDGLRNGGRASGSIKFELPVVSGN